MWRAVARLPLPPPFRAPCPWSGRTAGRHATRPSAALASKRAPGCHSGEDPVPVGAASLRQGAGRRSVRGDVRAVTSPLASSIRPTFPSRLFRTLSVAEGRSICSTERLPEGRRVRARRHPPRPQPDRTPGTHGHPDRPSDDDSLDVTASAVGLSELLASAHSDAAT